MNKDVKLITVYYADKLKKKSYSQDDGSIGKQINKWQNREYVFRYFGEKGSKAKKIYRKFVIKGIKEGSRPELVGGGLIRSQGRWSQVISMRRHGNKELSDERVLGSGDFVEKIIKEADEQFKYRFSKKEKRKRVRFRIATKLFSEYGIPIAEIARNTGVSISAVLKMVNKSIHK